MDGRPVLLLAMVAMFGLIAMAGAGATAVATDESLVDDCAAEPPEDFSPPDDGNETIGWFDGYWYNEPLDIDASDGITEEELERLSARTAARFEAMRCLPMEAMPPVDIITREEFANETAGMFDDVSERERLHDNAQFETLLMISSEEDSIQVREDSRTVTVGGYYNFVEERIVVITDDEETMMIDEPILAHELGHAIQDQHFDLETYHRPTTDIDNAKLGVIEGDVHLIEQEYLEHCEEDRWEEPCVVEDSGDNGAAGSPPNWGLYFKQFQPYSDGPNFVDHVYEQGGWEAVNDLYDDMPQSSQQVIVPEKFGTVPPEDLVVVSTPSGEWERLTNDNGPDHNVMGKAGIASMFIGQSFERLSEFDHESAILDQDEFYNLDEDGDVDGFNPINYDVWPADGWAGDRLYVYTNEENETASVWKTAWQDEEHRDEFLTAYEQLALDRGGEPVDGYAHTWEFGDDSEYEMAVTLYPDGDRLWVVTAPTVDELDQINANVEPMEEDDADDTPTSPSPGDNGVSPGDDDDGITPPNGDDTDDDGDERPPVADDTDDTIPGFGPVAALLALMALLIGLRRR